MTQTLKADRLRIVDGGLLPILVLEAGETSTEIVLTKEHMQRLTISLRAHAARLENRMKKGRRRG